MLLASGDGDRDQLSCEFKVMLSCSYSLTTNIVRIALTGAVTSRVGLLAPANRAGAFLWLFHPEGKPSGVN